MSLRRRPFRTPRRARLAAMVTATLLVGACGSAIGGTAVIAPPSAAPTSGVTTAPSIAAPPTGEAPVPAGLEKYYSQQLSWGSCVEFAATSTDEQIYGNGKLECANLSVPLSYDDPSTGGVTIGVLRTKAGDTSQRIGSLLFNPGGPGASGMSLVAQMGSYGLGAELAERFDLVGFDPRGVGSSRPAVQCQTGAEMDADRASNQRVRNPEEVAAAEAQAKRWVQQCIDRTGKDSGVDGAAFLGSIGTRDVARDMDILRAALGDRQLSYVGFSYGTQIGWVYAEQFPANVRAMVLDGALDPNQDPAAALVAQSAGFQQAFDGFAAWCVERPTCVLGSDPAKATEVYRGLMAPLLDKPLAMDDGRVLTVGDAAIGTIQALYAESFWEQLADALLAYTKGDGKGLMALADMYHSRDAAGEYSNILEVLTAVHCMDDPRLTVEEALLASKEANAAAPFLDFGDPPMAMRSECDFWPAEPTLTRHTPKVDGLAPVLVVSTTGDPATPYQAGVDLAKALGGSLLTIDGTRHTGFLLSGITCADEIGIDYLINLTLPEADTRCS